MSNKTDPKSNLTAVAYIRVSTGKQKDKFSEDVQRKEIRLYADHHKPPLKIIKWFEESRSGYQYKRRKAFYEMLDYVTENDIGHMLYYVTSRASRNDLDWSALKEVGRRCHNVKENRAFTPGSSDRRDRRAKNEEDGNAVDSEKDSINTGDAVASAQAEKVERGEYPGSPPLGYLTEPIMVDGKPLIVKGDIKNRTVIDSVQGPLMKKMFELCASGEARSLRDLNSVMRNLGQRSRAGRILTLEEVRRYLRTHFYYGTFRWGGKLYPNKGTYEPIISKALFDQVQDVLDGRRIFTKRGKDFKYKDLIKCAYCGCDIIGDPHDKVNKKTQERKTHTYYRCTGGKSEAFYQEHYKLSKCPLYYGPYYTEKDIDDLFEISIRALDVDPETYDWVRDQLEEDYKNLKALNAAEAISIRKQLAHNETAGGNMAEAAAKAKSERVRAVYEKKIDELERLSADMEARLEEMQKGQEAVTLDETRETLELSKSLKDKYLSAPPEKRARLNRLMFRTVKLARVGDVIRPVEGGEYVAWQPFYIEWNEPFKTIWDLGFIREAAEAKEEWDRRRKAVKERENKDWRGRRDSNSRPPA